MIGIDTNVLLRLLVRDLDTQVRAAEKFIATHCSSEEPGYVSRVVIIEIVWALKGFYGYDRAQIAAAIRALLNVSEFEVESADEIHAALADFETSAPGFVDCLLARTNAAIGCKHTVTFDRKAAKLKGYRLLSGG
jgi:predicted nucleic-acid-binding protein